MSTLKRLANKLQSFGASAGGQISLTFGLTIVPMVAVAGMALDYTQYTYAKSKLQQIADGAALAVTAKYMNTGDESGLTEVAETYIAENIKIAGISGVENIKPVLKFKGDTVELKLLGSFSTTFMKLVSVDSIDLQTTESGGSQGEAKVATEVRLPMFNEENRGEFALVMDYSTSMNETVGGKRKYISMRNEMNELFDDLTQNGSNPYVKFALVPFSHVVKAAMQKRFFKGLSGAAKVTHCIDDRGWGYNRSSATPDTSTASHASKFNLTDWYTNPSRVANESGGTAGECPANLSTMLPLTSDHAAVRAQSDAMVPDGYTHVALGLEMGWHVLTPNEPFTEGVADLGSPYKTTKAIVLLTDGKQTAEGYGESNRTDDRGDENLAANCETMKAQGIRILTVAFDLTEPASVTRLRNCASEDPKNPGSKLFWNPLTNAQLSVSFNDIRKSLIRDLYVSR